jgi:hypothetical protein
MDRILDLTESRKAKSEKNELFRDAGQELLSLLEQQREDIPEEYLTFLLALAVSDQALHYAAEAQSRQAGLQFMENLLVTARQLFETHAPETRRKPRSSVRTDGTPGRILEFPPGELPPDDTEEDALE